MDTSVEFHLRHEAADEAKRLVKHPAQELARLEHQAAEGETAASLLVIVVGVFAAVWTIAALLYGLVVFVEHVAV